MRCDRPSSGVLAMANSFLEDNKCGIVQDNLSRGSTLSKDTEKRMEKQHSRERREALVVQKICLRLILSMS